MNAPASSETTPILGTAMAGGFYGGRIRIDGQMFALIGLIGQPFWLYETHRKKQWGIFLLSVFYCAAWFRTVIAYWP